MSNLSDYFPALNALDVYTPATRSFDGTDWFHDTYTAAGSQCTIVGRFKINSFTGTSTVYTIARASDSTQTYARAYVLAYASDHSTANYADRVHLLAQNTAGTTICRLISPTGYLDGEWHSFIAAFDASAGTAVWIIDGVDADDTGNGSRTAPTTGTVNTGAGCYFTVANAATTSLNPMTGSLGFIGMKNAYITDYTLFFNSYNDPLKLNEVSWTEWDGQPDYWSESCDFVNNAGSAGNATQVGTPFINEEPVFQTGVRDSEPARTLGYGLVSWWALDETMTAGVDTIYDSHGSVDLLENGAGSLVLNYSDATFGQVLDFAGSGSSNIYVAASSARQHPYNSNFSVAGWVRFDQLASTVGAQCLIARADNGANGFTFIDWYVLLGGSDVIQMTACVGSNNYNAISPLTVSVDTWYFVYAGYDAENNQVSVSVDAANLTTGAVTGDMNTGGDQFKMGRRSFDATWDAYLDGKMSRWALWSRLQTTREREWLAAAPRNYSDIVIP